MTRPPITRPPITRPPTAGRHRLRAAAYYQPPTTGRILLTPCGWPHTTGTGRKAPRGAPKCTSCQGVGEENKSAPCAVDTAEPNLDSRGGGGILEWGGGGGALCGGGHGCTRRVDRSIPPHQPAPPCACVLGIISSRRVTVIILTTSHCFQHDPSHAYRFV